MHGPFQPQPGAIQQPTSTVKKPPPQKVGGQSEDQRPQPKRAGSGQPGSLDAAAQPAAEAEGGTGPKQG